MSEDYRGITKNLFTFAAGENRAELEHLSKQYGHTKDLEALAKIAEMGLKQLGFEKEGSDIAKRLRKKRKDDKPSRWMMYREIDRLYAYLRFDEKLTETETYEVIRNIYFSDEDREETKSEEAIRVQHKRWAKKEYERQQNL